MCPASSWMCQGYVLLLQLVRAAILQTTLICALNYLWLLVIWLFAYRHAGMNLPEGKQTLSGHAWAGRRLRRSGWLQRGLTGSWEARTRESQPGDGGPHPSLRPKPAGTAGLIASGCVLKPAKTDVHTVTPVHKGERYQTKTKQLTKDFRKMGLRKLQQTQRETVRCGWRWHQWKRAGFGDLLVLKLSSAMEPTWRNKEDALVFYFPVYF